MATKTALIKSPLAATAILEKDKKGEVLVAWSFPAVPEADAVEPVLIARSQLGESAIALQYSFSKFRQYWLYIFSHVVAEDNKLFPRVTAFSVCVLSTLFDPERYAALTQLMSKLYAASASPLRPLEAYLAAYNAVRFTATAAEVGEAEGAAAAVTTYDEAAFDARQALLVTSLKDVVRMFGTEIILLWAALMMKKRVAVYSDKRGILLRVIRALPLLVIHRQNWGVLRPFVNLADGPELDDLRSAGVFVAGFTDAAVRTRSDDLYDVLVDVPARSITLSEHSKADFAMSGFHREVATLLTDAADAAEVTDQQAVKALLAKIRDLLARLEQLRDADGFVSVDGLKQHKLPNNLDRFLYAVASAEGMTKTTAA